MTGGANSTITLSFCSSRYTGKERDSESGLDYFGARYYGSSMGRFLSPDYSDDGGDPYPVPSADFENPQSLNLYAYVKNDPLSLTDPDGHGCFDNDATYSTNANGDLVVNGDCDWNDFFPTLVQQSSQFINQMSNAAQQVGQQVMSYLSAPRDLGCLNRATGSGAVAGAEIGTAVGLAAGPFDEITVPAGATGGFGIGGAAGFGMDMSACMTGAGGSEGSRGSGSSARLTKPQQRQTARYLGMKEVKGLTSQGQPVFENNGRYFSFSNTSHTAGEVFKEVDRNGNRIATTDLNLNRIGP